MPELYLRMRLLARLSHGLTGLLLAAARLAQNGILERDLAAWRTQHEAEVLKPDGWLSLVGLEWLEPGDNTVGSGSDNKIRLAKGPAHLAVLHLEGETVTLNPPSGGFPQDFLVAGALAKPPSLRAGPNKNKIAPRLTIRDPKLYVLPPATPLASSGQA